MRLNHVFAFIAALVLAVIVSALAASAGGVDKTDVPHGWAHERVVRHWVYYPRYHHIYHSNTATDPYAYQYQPRGYYPYYNSGYWRPRHLVAKNRAHFRHPKYYQAWGANRKWYHHYRWHAKNQQRLKTRYDHGHW